MDKIDFIKFDSESEFYMPLKVLNIWILYDKYEKIDVYYYNRANTFNLFFI